MDLTDRVALVTGASRGVGRAIAVALAAAGAHVACAARATRDRPQRNPGTLEETVEAVRARGREALAVPTNLARREEVQAMVDAAVGHFGRVDVLVNNAAITFPGDLAVDLKRYDLMMEVNLHAPFLATRAVAPGMCERGEGAILNVSSVAALNVFPGLMVYGVSKLALERMSLDLASQLAGRGVAVNVFRIDIPVASEGFVANSPGADTSDWEPCEVAAEGALWMLQQPATYTGRLEGMLELREREGIMKSRSARPHTPIPGARRSW